MSRSTAKSRAPLMIQKLLECGRYRALRALCREENEPGARRHEQRVVGTNKDNLHVFGQSMHNLARPSRMLPQLGLHPSELLGSIVDLNKEMRFATLVQVVYHSHPSQLYRKAPGLMLNSRAQGVGNIPVVGVCDFSAHESVHWCAAACEHAIKVMFGGSTDHCVSMAVSKTTVTSITDAFHARRATSLEIDDAHDHEAIVQPGSLCAGI